MSSDIISLFFFWLLFHFFIKKSVCMDQSSYILALYLLKGIALVVSPCMFVVEDVIYFAPFFQAFFMYVNRQTNRKWFIIVW